MAAQLNLNTDKIEKIKTQVQSINDTANAQATTISEIAALLEGKSVPEGGSSGGGSVETCTVNFSGFRPFGSGGPMCYQTVEDGEVVLKILQDGSLDSVTMVCNSFLVVSINSFYTDDMFSATENIEIRYVGGIAGGYINMLIIWPKMSAGESGTVTMSAGDYD